ncbi:MAG: hypothetical protein K2M87_02515 [Muribaculaceae bacterium]|nr:hypothetical protein [Muribaculaceae bacterium]
MILQKIQQGLGQAGASLASLIKVALMSRRATPRERNKDLGTIIIMGNGPSLRDAMEHNLDTLMRYPRMAVNLSALAPDFQLLKPEQYILADIAFFLKEKSGKVPALWEALAAVNWEMTLWLPATARKMPEVGKLPDNVKVKYYNLTPIEGWKWLTHRLYDSGLGMPRPRNVLIPAIICAMRCGYTRILLIGADHNWSKTLWVTDRNRVVSVQPHFYKDDDAELKRAEEIFKNVRLHEVYENYAIAFRSYHNLKPYLEKRDIKVLNATPGSFIDAFDRTTLGAQKE